MRNILEVARLVRVLESDDISWAEKVQQTKMVRDNGDITEDEALDLLMEYTAGAPKKRCVGKSYYEYDFDGEHSIKDLSECDVWEFFRCVAMEFCFDDCSGVNITKIVYDGREFKYLGWQAGMKYEFVGTGDNAAETYVVWLPEYDH